MKDEDSKRAKPRSRRGRPPLSEAERADVRQRIAEAARDLFQREGYARVSIRKIAKAVGYTPMAIYRYYASKLEILQTLWGGVFAAAFAEVDAVAPQPNPTAQLVAIATAYVRYWIEHPEHYRLVFMAEGVTQPDVSVFLDDPEIIARFAVFAVGPADGSARAHALAELTRQPVIRGPAPSISFAPACAASCSDGSPSTEANASGTRRAACYFQRRCACWGWGQGWGWGS